MNAVKQQSAVSNNTFDFKELGHFHGTTHWYRHPLSSMVYTDGVKYLADQAGCFWLIDLIASSLIELKCKSDPRFFAVHFTAFSNDSARINFTCGNSDVILSKKIPFTDFPVRDRELVLYLAVLDNDGNYCLMVPSEN